MPLKTAFTVEIVGNFWSTVILIFFPDPLRALFPAVGIIGSFLVTALFIAGGSLFEKLRGEKVETTETDYDGRSR